jgi:DNA-binding XRE family transcriptional regulator
MDLGITQKEAARQIGANQWTVINWEKDRTQVAVRYVPAVIRFLGYDPFPKGKTLGERLRDARSIRGLSYPAMAQELDVDPSTLLNWECGRHNPPVNYWPRILELTGPEELASEASLPDRL